MYLGSWELKTDKSGTYDAEKFSDTFASSYGYAKEIAEVFSKKHLSRVDENVEKNKFGTIISEAQLFSNILAYFSDPHPSRLYRVNYAKKKLEYELQNNRKYLTRKQAKDIEQQIRDIDELLKNSEGLFIEVNKKLNKYFNYDEKKDKAGSRVKDSDIFDFEKGVLRELMKNKK